jgi:hypothetical protein
VGASRPRSSNSLGGGPGRPFAARARFRLQQISMRSSLSPFARSALPSLRRAVD